MRTLEAVLILFYSVMLWFEVRVGLAEYAAFKLLTETMARQRVYRRWLLRSVLCFSGSAFAGLAILGRLQALMSLPSEFAGVSERMRQSLPDVHFSSAFAAGFGSSLLVGAVLGRVIAAKLADRRRSPIVGDVKALLPRNWPETGYTLLLSLNAGFGEELFFRLFLPLLVALLSGNAILAFLVAGIVFGSMHVYQGTLGVVLTMFTGFVLTFIYLATGSIWVAVAVHAGIDVLGLVVRPTAVRLRRKRGTDAAVEVR